MARRGPPSEQRKQALTTVLEQGPDRGEHPLDQFIRRGACDVLHVACEQEVTEGLGRAHYQRGVRRRLGWRNGYEPKDVQSPMGALSVARPQGRGTAEPFPARVATAVGTRSRALERLATRRWVRGRSQQDVATRFEETVGGRVISRHGVSQVSRHVHADFDTWRRRARSTLPVVSLFLDAISLAVRHGTDEKEGCSVPLACWRPGRRCGGTWPGAAGNRTMRG